MMTSKESAIVQDRLADARLKNAKAALLEALTKLLNDVLPEDSEKWHRALVSWVADRKSKVSS